MDAGASPPPPLDNKTPEAPTRHVVGAPPCVCTTKPFHTHCTPRVVSLERWLASLNPGASPPPPLEKEKSCGGCGLPCVCTAFCVQRQPFRGTLRTSVGFAQSGDEARPSPFKNKTLAVATHRLVCALPLLLTKLRHLARFPEKMAGVPQSGGQPLHPPSITRLVRWLQTASRMHHLVCVHRQPFPHTPHTSHRFPTQTRALLHAGTSTSTPVK